MTILPHGYQRAWLRSDAVAGVTTAAVVIPKSLAFASIAGLPLQAGMYVALAPMLVYALLGSSRLLSVSSTSTIAILTATQLALLPQSDPAALMAAASTLALLVGGFLLLAGVLRLGFVANFISDPVLTGFKAGLGIVILADQLPKLLGVHIDKGHFLHQLGSTLAQLPATNGATLLLAGVTLVVLFAVEHFYPRLPGPLFAVMLGVAAAAVLGLAQYGVALTGPIPSRIPAPNLPSLAFVSILCPGALGIALMAFTESVAAGRAFARRSDPLPKPNRELIALGAANVAGSFFQSFPAGGGTSQTAVNARAGARTQLAQLVTVAAVLATLLFLAPWVSLLPQATLAAIVVVTSLPLLSVGDFRSILKVRRTEFLWALLATVGVVALGTLQGILVAVAVSVLTLFYQANHPLVYVLRRKPDTEVFRPQSPEHPEDECPAGLLIVRTEGRMTFASAPQTRDRLNALIATASPEVVILECSAIPDFEYTALRALGVAEEKLREAGVRLWLSALNPRALEVVRRSPLGVAIGEQGMFYNLRDAVAAFQAGHGAPATKS